MAESEDTKLISPHKHSEDKRACETILTGNQLGTGWGRWSGLPHLSVSGWDAAAEHYSWPLQHCTAPLFYVPEHEVSSLIHHPSSQPCAKSFTGAGTTFCSSHLILLTTLWGGYHDYHFIHRGKSLNKLEVSKLSTTFPGGSEVKASAGNAGDLGSTPGSGRSPGEGNSNPLQYSGLENPMDGGAWWATVHGVAKNRTWPRDFTHYLIYT